MDILFSLSAIIVAFAVGVLAWPVESRPSRPERYHIYGR